MIKKILFLNLVLFFPLALFLNSYAQKYTPFELAQVLNGAVEQKSDMKERTFVILLGAWGYNNYDFRDLATFDESIKKDVQNVKEFFSQPIIFFGKDNKQNLRGIYPASSLNQPIIIEDQYQSKLDPEMIAYFTTDLNDYIKDNKLGDKVTSSDSIILYYSGHGIGKINDEDGDSIGYILPPTTRKNRIKRYAIGVSKIIGDLEELKPKSITAFFDMCLTDLKPIGTKSIDNPSTGKEIKNITYKKRHTPEITIYLAANESKTEAIYTKEGSKFTNVLLSGLNGNADINSDGKIVRKEVANFLKEELEGRAKVLPKDLKEPLSSILPKQLTSFANFINNYIEIHIRPNLAELEQGKIINHFKSVISNNPLKMAENEPLKDAIYHMLNGDPTKLQDKNVLDPIVDLMKTGSEY